MSERVDLACTVCTEEFVVPMAVYQAHSGVVLCPCCGAPTWCCSGRRGAKPIAPRSPRE